MQNDFDFYRIIFAKIVQIEPCEECLSLNQTKDFDDESYEF
jgi:hypothetical protein